MDVPPSAFDVRTGRNLVRVPLGAPPSAEPSSPPGPRHPPRPRTGCACRHRFRRTFPRNERTSWEDSSSASSIGKWPELRIAL